MKSLNSDKVKTIAYKNPTASVVFQELAQRERARKETDLKRLEDKLLAEGFKVVPAEFIEIFETLAKEGVGEIVKNKRGTVTFKWHYSLKEVAKAAVSPASAGSPEIVESQPPTNGILKTNDGHKRSLTVVYGFNRKASLLLPNDLTRSEVKDLIEILLKEIG